MVTGSIWGCHRSQERREKGFAESWHTTAGKVELTALAHNETVLLLDETKRAGRKDKERVQAVLDISFLAWLRAPKKNASPMSDRPEAGGSILSAPQITVSLNLLNGAACRLTMLNGDGLSTSRYRMVGTVSTELHSSNSGQTFTDNLKVRCRKFCGVVGRTFNRSSERFATVFAAGSLAIKYRIFPWNRDDLFVSYSGLPARWLAVVEAHAHRRIPRFLACGAGWFAP